MGTQPSHDSVLRRGRGGGEEELLHYAKYGGFHETDVCWCAGRLCYVAEQNSITTGMSGSGG